MLFRKIIKQLSINLFIVFPLSVVGKIVTLPVFYFMKPEQIALPVCLKWFDLADNWPELIRTDSTTYKNKVIPEGWWARYTWTQWRNPVNYFQYKYLGFINTSKVLIHDQDNSEVAYWYYAELEDGHWEYSYNYHYKLPFIGEKIFTIRMGWKIMPMSYGEYVQFVASIMPFDS